MTGKDEQDRQDAILLLISNAPDEDQAERIALALVNEGLAACVNILARCRSVYRWNNAIEHADEVPMLIKTRVSKYGALQTRFCELHPYAVPELIALPIAQALPEYASWVLAQTR